MVTICGWAQNTEDFYEAYHNDEWGVPEYDDRALYEKLILDGFQAGLSWRTVLVKRDNFRKAFKGFDPQVLARWGEKDVLRLLQNEGIIRHRGKIEGTIINAKLTVEMAEKENGLSQYLWDFVDGKPIQNKWKTMAEVPAKTPLSEAIAKDMKKRGFKFCGPTIIYAFMQAVGMVNDHSTKCYRHSEVKKLQR